MPSPPYIIGIDLGTTNCAVAFAHLTGDANPAVVDFPLPQLQRPGEVATLPLLPSCLYSAGEHELPPGSTQLPWGESPRLIVGAFARWQGARVPGRMIASAKSWLCHPGVDRSSPILPWGAPADVLKISPVDASARLLGHIAAAWNQQHPDAPMATQEVIITVPASFDEAARELTATAARQAGLEKFLLVEEPQAAFYDFAAHHRRDLAAALRDARLVLVVDVGGGTTDFTLIQVQVDAANGEPTLRRIAVGDHLMLGGDNMDAALARFAEERMLGGDRKFSATQWTQLLQIARDAKESLLGREAPDRYGVAVAAEGSRLLRSTLSTELGREEVERLLLDGFLPACAPDDSPRRAARTALQELGLPYASDAAITRHLAAFLCRHATAASAALGANALASPNANATAALPRPDAILLNGGVFNSPRIADRLVTAMSAWWPESPRIPLLPHRSLDLAVARGAVGHGLAKKGLCRRIGGGSAHAFYVGIAGEKGRPTNRAVCLIPRGHEEGQVVELTSQPFKLTLGRPVQFPLFSTTSDGQEKPGDIVELTEAFRALPPIHTLLKTAEQPASPTAFQKANQRPGAVPVHLRALLTELGTLELWCVCPANDERWRLQFELRAATSSADASTGPGNTTNVTEALPARFPEARDAIERVFGHQPRAVEAREVKQLRRTLEKLLGPREEWRLPLLRELWGLLQAGARNRRRSADHERVFFQLAGYCLRPGFGYPLDAWRCEQMFRLFGEGVTFHAEPQGWSEFWILWRRIVGGLTEAQQQELWNYLKPHLSRRLAVTASPASTPAKAPKGTPEGLDEMVRVAASLEHLDAAEKVGLGNWVFECLKNPPTTGGLWAWALGRLGARLPLYGSSHKTVDAVQAAAWLSALLDLGLNYGNGNETAFAFAAVQLCRLTGDRSRDLDDDLRKRTVAALQAAKAPEEWVLMLTDQVQLNAADETRALGDTLPIGLRLH
jgi:molecular chaperone DnaK (HSP70)